MRVMGGQVGAWPSGSVDGVVRSSRCKKSSLLPVIKHSRLILNPSHNDMTRKSYKPSEGKIRRSITHEVNFHIFRGEINMTSLLNDVEKSR